MKALNQEEIKAVNDLKEWKKDKRKLLTKNETIFLNVLSSMTGSLFNQSLSSLERKNVLKEMNLLISDFLEKK